MSIPHSKSGESFDVRPLGSALRDAVTTAMVKAEGLEVIRLIVPAGKSIPMHKAKGVMTLLCLEGRIAFESGGQTTEMSAGQMLYLPAGAPHAVTGLEDASLLLTIWKSPTEPESRKDEQ